MSPRWPLVLRIPEASKLQPVLLAMLALGAAAPRARAQRTIADDAPRGSVAGTVYDSLAGRPLAGAIVQLAIKGSQARVVSTTTGAGGEFEFAGVQPGSYIIGFFHPALDSLGLVAPPRSLEIPDATLAHVALAFPSAVTIRNVLCAPSSAADSSGLVIGFVRDADKGIPLAGTQVVMTWREVVFQNGIRAHRREVAARANDQGWFALCGVPSDGPIMARAELGSDASGFIELSAPPRGVLHRDFYLPRDSAAVTIAANDSSGSATGWTIRRGSARLTGVVRDPEGKPVSGAQLLVWGSGVTGTTREDGNFVLDSLPAGSQAVEARYVGYAPRRVAVDLASNTTRTVAITFDKRADLLDEVTVYGEPSKRHRDLTGFLHRRKVGLGHFLTRADIEKRHPFQFTDLFRMMPGFRVVPGSDYGYRIVSTRGGFGGACQPEIYLDGIKLYYTGDLDFFVTPRDIAGLEAYAGPSTAPLQYSSGLCGSILIWTGPDLGVSQN